MTQILIYTEVVNPRKLYIFNHIFSEILGITYAFTTDLNEFRLANQCKFIYTLSKIDDFVFFPTHQFINEINIDLQQLDFDYEDEVKVPFKIHGGDFFSFDVFSASFYLLSRYEEYLPSSVDKHGRFCAEQSLAYKNNFLHKPLIDIWAIKIFEHLKKHFIKLTKKGRSFQFIPTIDIDEPYFFSKTNLFGKIKKILKVILAIDFKFLFKDPYSTYAYISKLHNNYQFKTVYFFLLANKHKFDHAPMDNFLNGNYIKLIKILALENSIGIHPSYESNENQQSLNKEINILNSIIGKPITFSRQHYLKLTLPSTYIHLINQGIAHDFSMGYASKIGFRASTCTSFFWYNLHKEEITSLKVHPFAIMDQTLKSYLHLSKNQAIQHSVKLMEEVVKVNGTFITLWHNESLSDFGFWKGWRIVYEQILKTANNFIIEK